MYLAGFGSLTQSATERRFGRSAQVWHRFARLFGSVSSAARREHRYVELGSGDQKMNERDEDQFPD